MKKNQRFGYTILEIVIAISLIAIFVALPIVAYNSFMKRSRDAQRKSDVSRIQAALEQYKTDNGIYPSALSDLVEEGYLAELPTDPLDGQSVPGVNGAIYGYDNNYNVTPDGNNYNMGVPLEEESTGGGAGDSDKKYIVVNPGGQKENPIPTTGFTSPTIQLRPSNTILPTRFNSPTPTPTFTPSPTRTPTPTPNADLVIQSITRSGAGYNFNVCNVGTGTNYMTGWWYTLWVEGRYWDRYDFDPPLLAAGQCQQVTMSCDWLSWFDDPDCISAITINAQIDRFNQVSEQNETNNTRAQTFPAATATPTPTPRLCWGYNGNCQASCNTTAIEWTTGYKSCTAGTSCWMTQGRRCGNNGAYVTSAQQFSSQSNYWAQCNCQGPMYTTPVSYYGSSMQCSTDGTGTCYEFYGSYTINPVSKSYMGTSCYNITSGCDTPGSGGTGGSYASSNTCTWQNNVSVCGTTYAPTNPDYGMVRKTGTTCSLNGTGQCYAAITPVTTYTGGGASCTANNTLFDTAYECEWY